MPTKTVTPGIMRVDFPDRRTHGWMMRIYRQGKHYREYFADRRFGGKRKAREAAEARHAQLLKELPAARTSKDVLSTRNRTGAVGVYIAKSSDRRWPGCEYWSYCATWTTQEGIREKISFSWTKYGKRQAWELACLARELEIHDRDTVVARFHSQATSRRQPRKKK